MMVQLMGHDGTQDRDRQARDRRFSYLAPRHVALDRARVLGRSPVHHRLATIESPSSAPRPLARGEGLAAVNTTDRTDRSASMPRHDRSWTLGSGAPTRQRTRGTHRSRSGSPRG